MQQAERSQSVAKVVDKLRAQIMSLARNSARSLCRSNRGLQSQFIALASREPEFFRVLDNVLELLWCCRALAGDDGGYIVASQFTLVGFLLYASGLCFLWLRLRERAVNQFGCIYKAHSGNALNETLETIRYITGWVLRCSLCWLSHCLPSHFDEPLG